MERVPADVTVVVPVERGRTSDAYAPDGVARVDVEHEAGERAAALDAAVADARTTFVLVLEPRAGIDRASLEALVSRCWDAPAAYPALVHCEEDFSVRETPMLQPYCPHRLRIVNYVGPTAVVRRDAWLAHGGWGEGAWDLWLRLPELKPCPEAHCWLRTAPASEAPPAPPAPPLEATFYAQGLAVQTYWRCQLPARRLPAAVQAGLPSLVGDLHLAFPEHRGAAVLATPGDGARAVVAALLQERGVPVLVEVDDNYLGFASAHARAGWAERAGSGNRPSSTERHRSIAASADAVIVASEALGRLYRQVNDNVFVCPNAIEPADWPEPGQPDDGVVRVGWFASPSHVDDRELVEPALEWASRQRGVEVIVMGVGRDADGRSWWSFPHRHLPFDDDIGRYRRQLGLIDVGLAPIVPSDWAVCRSDLKALEYAMAGACPVLSDVIPYADWRDEEGCLKAATSDDFLRAVKRLVAAPDEARALAREARARVLAERTVAATLWRWQEALAAAAATRTPTSLGSAQSA
jgi:hypothetical protein